MKSLLIIGMILLCTSVHAQELFVFTEPASNMPARSVSAKFNSMFIGKQEPYNRFLQRYQPAVMLGITKKLMLHVATTFADMNTKRFRWESVYLYSKYRFLSHDQEHAHFRMAVFASASYTQSPFHFDEINLNGDKSGVELGVIATKLIDKLALSATVSNVQVLHQSRNKKIPVYIPSRIYQAVNYSFSSGYLLLPRNYTDFKQTNVNLYVELLGQQAFDRNVSFVDLAPAVQFIFNSNFKINAGYRFQLSGTMQRMGRKQWTIGLERTFLNALKSRKH